MLSFGPHQEVCVRCGSKFSKNHKPYQQKRIFCTDDCRIKAHTIARYHPNRVGQVAFACNDCGQDVKYKNQAGRNPEPPFCYTCRRNHRNIRVASEKPPVVRKCKNCLTEFVATKGDYTYCNSDCSIVGKRKTNLARAKVRRKIPEVAAAQSARKILRRCLHLTQQEKAERTLDMLGYTSDKLRERIEFQFQPGMSWDNRTDWHIDHRKPVTAFIRQGIKEPRVINALCNLKPMWASENISKGDSWNGIRASNDNLRQYKIAV